MNQLKNQQGYALLLTLGIVVILTILGASLLMLTSNGASKNEVRQDITRSSDLSQKGIDLVTTQVNSELISFLGENGRPRTEFTFQLERILNKYMCTESSSIPIQGETGTYKACIESYVDTVDSENLVNPLKKLVTFKSIGTAGDANREMFSKIEIGAATAPEALRYAIGTNIDTIDGLQNGEGNLLMHGGVEIKGDLKVDGNIVTSTNGYALLGGDQWIPSLAPSTLPLEGAKTARLFLGKNSYTFDEKTNYANHIIRSNFSTSTYSLKTNIADLFRPGNAPTLVSREPVQSPIAITDQKKNFEYGNSSNVTVLNAGSNYTIADKSLSSSKVYLYHDFNGRYCYSQDWWGNCTNYSNVQRFYSETGTYTFTGTNSFKQASTKGSIKMVATDIKFTNGLYVEGDLSIGNNSTSYDVNRYSPVTIDGPIYVNGDLDIQGADLKSNALIYVNGEVNISHSRVNGKVLPNKKQGSLIVLSKGNIKISNNSVNYDDPSYIKGFFYSEKDFEMFGVGSNMKIDGGISARKIVLNAIRGRAKDDPFSGSYKIPGRNDYFEGVAEQNKRNSRLQVIYDLEIISTYSDLKQQEPVIYTVDPPTEKERDY
ncbi:hypothetical protein A1A1_14959 [Planococcus antarcticus DSM 14505]|uniref:Uncharacterized protein n=1 Tax=Planococcus antarcticus DSM 14505 TaxID=1185653 RepID=A0AA87IIU6_9BACL|nr:hypothetical protein [Planococcus antarcticus]EIM05626.1 hypothetical protein A1A1_14959 [Planococcus antarcticus DSM 14505]